MQVMRLAEQAALTVDPGLAERRRERAQQRDARVILSFRVSRSCDLRRPVVDSVADGTLAA
jgi:hypothetical protein